MSSGTPGKETIREEERERERGGEGGERLLTEYAMFPITFCNVRNMIDLSAPQLNNWRSLRTKEKTTHTHTHTHRVTCVRTSKSECSNGR